MSGIFRGLNRALRSLGRIGLGALLLWLAGFVVFVETLEPPRAAEDLRAEGIVVLTGGADRIEDAIRLLKGGQGRRLLISGVNEQVSAEQMRRAWPGHEAAFDCCIDLDFRARNTVENAREGAAWAMAHGFRRILLVTAHYHMPRARLAFAGMLPGVEILPYPVVPDRARLEDWWRDSALMRLLAIEYTKFVAAFLAARLRIAPPGR